MSTLMQRAGRMALDLVFPPRCALCDEGGVLLCEACAGALPPADGRRCDRCWMPIAGGTTCTHCIAEAPAFSSLRAAFVMDAGARRLAHELKYEGMTSLAEPMARLMAGAVDATSADMVTAVPLHRGRERRRGYNQAAELARRVAETMDLAFDARAARRVRDTAPLVKAMSRAERRAIVAGAFRADAGRAGGRTVLLVDDVVTTGATLDACARALLDAGAREVRCLTWARAD